MNRAVVERTTPSGGVANLDFEQSQIGAVGFPAGRVFDGCQPDLCRLADGFEHVRSFGMVFSGCRVGIGAENFERAGLERHVLERVEELVVTVFFTDRTAVQSQFHVVVGRYDVDRFDRSGGIIPMADDVRAPVFGVDPTVPHHLMGEKGVFRDAHRIDHTACTVIGFAALVGVRVGEDDFRAARADAPACPRTLEPIIEPAPHTFDGQHVLIVVVIAGIGAAVERTVSLLVVGVTV